MTPYEIELRALRARWLQAKKDHQAALQAVTDAEAAVHNAIIAEQELSRQLRLMAFDPPPPTD